MEKPFVVCHMLTSLDGKIDGDYMSAPECLPALQQYGALRPFYQCQATLYGTTTMLGGYAAGVLEALPHSETVYPYEDHIAQTEVRNYIVSIDPTGMLAWSAAYSEQKGRAKAHFIEVLTTQVDADYLAYLRNAGISYLFAGDSTLDCALALHKLKTLFGIERLMIAGGGTVNWSFLREDLIDEVSVVVAPVADGNRESVSIFEQFDSLPPRAPVAFALKEAKSVDENVLWLRYIPQK